MKLILEGADCRYAVEQLMITLFPEERHLWELPEGASEDDIPEMKRVCHVRVRNGAQMISAEAQIVWGDRIERGGSRVRRENDAVRDGALERYVVRRAVYRAALAFLPNVPEWGALSGVRPAKLGRLLIREKGSSEAAVHALMQGDFVSREKAKLTVTCAEAALKVLETREARDFDVYIGIPFCPTRCAYCSFVSAATAAQGKLIPAYVEKLIAELAQGAELSHKLGLRLRTLYMGGGTPTTLSPEQLDRVLTAAEALGNPEEITVEAGRPDTIDAEKLAVLRAHGVGRVSVNPQTMNDEVLKRIGRRHTAQDIVDKMKLVRAAGFESVNMDLIAGLPGDTPESFANTLDRVMELEPENITVHTFARKRGATLFDTEQESPEILIEMLKTAREKLSGKYKPYYLYRQKYSGGSFENIGWTVPGHECFYNISMMEELSTVLSFGAGAVTKLIAPGVIRRVTHPKYAAEYLERECKFNEIEDFFAEFPTDSK